MSNVRYELTEKNIPGFEPQLLYLSVSKYGSDWMSTLHYHPHMEVLFVMEGEGFFHLDEKKYPIGRGSLVVVNPNRYHTESSSEKSALEMMKHEARQRGANAVYGVRITLTEATSGQGMLMVSASGSAMITR